MYYQKELLNSIEENPIPWIFLLILVIVFSITTIIALACYK